MKHDADLPVWDSRPIPDDVAGWIQGFKTLNPGLAQSLLDREDAISFVRLHYGAAEQTALATYAPPAAQADYLRLCLMYAVGGIYLDADLNPLEGLGELLRQATPGSLSHWHGVLNNNPMIFKAPGNLYLKACLDLATDNLLNRRFDDVLMSAGPGVLNAVRCVLDPQGQAGVEAMLAMIWRPVG